MSALSGPSSAVCAALQSTVWLGERLVRRVSSLHGSSTTERREEGWERPRRCAARTSRDSSRPVCVSTRSARVLGPFAANLAAISAFSPLTAITCIHDEPPISHNLPRNLQLSRPRRTRLAESGEFRPSRTNFCKLKELHPPGIRHKIRYLFPKLLRLI